MLFFSKTPVFLDMGRRGHWDIGAGSGLQLRTREKGSDKGVSLGNLGCCMMWVCPPMIYSSDIYEYNNILIALHIHKLNHYSSRYYNSL